MTSPSSSPDIYQVLARKASGEAYCLISAEVATSQDKDSGFLLGRSYLVVKANEQAKSYNYTTDPDKVFAEVYEYFNKLSINQYNAPKDLTVAEAARLKVYSTIDAYSRDNSLVNTAWRASQQSLNWATGWKPLEDSAKGIDVKMRQLTALGAVTKGDVLATSEASPATFNKAAKKLKKHMAAPQIILPQASQAASDPVQIIAPVAKVLTSSYAFQAAASTPAPAQAQNTFMAQFSSLTLNEKIDALEIINHKGQLNSQWQDELMAIYTNIWTERNFAGLVNTVTLAKMQKLRQFFAIAGSEGQGKWLEDKLNAFAKTNQIKH